MTAARARRSEAGQTTALVCAMLFTLTIFVALVANVGQLVNRRVALQVVADTGAWSGATTQAIQLNHYAFWSRLMQNAYKNASGVSLGFRASECWSGVAAVGLYYYAAGGMAAAIGHFSGAATGEARRHSLYNIDDLFPGERNNFDFSTSAGVDEGALIDPLNGNIFPMPLLQGDRLYTGDHEWNRETFTQIATEFSLKFTGRLPWAVSKAGSGYEQWQCATLLPPTSFPIILAGPAGFKLTTLGQPYKFTWRVKERRSTKALFFDSFFGPNAMPAMTAVAVAKPVGGDVHRGLSRYRAKMVPVSRYSFTAGFINDPRARRDRVLPGTMRQITY